MDEALGDQLGDGPAYYATGAHTRWRDVRAILHPPYTAWHLSYVVIGSVVGPRVSWSILAATVLAFFLAVGVAAHALDELSGRPLGTHLPQALLIAAAITGLGGAALIGVAGLERLGPWFGVFVVVGVALVLAYNLELFGGLVHNDGGFALAWGAFPVLTAVFAQQHTLPPSSWALALAAALLAAAQRSLSTPVRRLRRDAASVHGHLVLDSGDVVRIDRAHILAPLEKALRLLSWAVVSLAFALVLARLVH